MHKLAEASEDVWQIVKKGIDSSWKEIRETLKKTISKHSKVKKWNAILGMVAENKSFIQITHEPEQN